MTTIQSLTAHGPPELEISDREAGAVRYLEHGAPHWRIRWHYHDEYELHLIAASSGKMFVGDFVGSFQPGCLVLTGPRVPHNWVSASLDDVHYELRDHVVHFDHDTILGLARLVPELRMLLPMLERARFGIEFLQHGDIAERYILRIRESTGAARIACFCELLDILTRSPRQRLLSSTQIDLPAGDDVQKKIGRVLDHVTEHYGRKITLAEAAAMAGMSQSHFSRFFHKATGNRFSDFVNRVRIAKSCDLLSRTNKAISLICYEVGFKNIANFNRRFLQHKHMTPSQYREQARKRYQ